MNKKIQLNIIFIVTILLNLFISRAQQRGDSVILKCGNILTGNIIGEANTEYFIVGSKGEKTQFVKKKHVFSCLDSQGNTIFLAEKKAFFSRFDDRRKLLATGYIVGGIAIISGLRIGYNRIWKKGDDFNNFSDFADYQVYKRMKDPSPAISYMAYSFEFYCM